MKRVLCMAIIICMCVGFVPIAVVEAATQEADGADFISRSDGVWRWPTSRYAISDWAGCNGSGLCPFKAYDGHNSNHGGCTALHITEDGRGHNGIDIPVSYVDVYAMADGEVLSCVYNDSSRGTYIVIEHPAGKDSNNQRWSYYSYYQHLNEIKINVGDDVKAGDVIGQSGETGVSTGPHLHVGLLLGYEGETNPLGVLENKDWVITTGFQEGRILNNPAQNSAANLEYTDDCEANVKLHAGSVIYTLDETKVSIGENNNLTEYLAKCTRYDCAVELEITADCYPHTLPCNNTTASEYGYESPILTYKPLSEGDEVIATSLYMNTKGNYWYQLEEGSFVWSSYTQKSDIISPWVENGGFPAQIYDATYLQGTIVTGGSRLDSVQALVFRGNMPYGGIVLQSDLVKVNEYSYPLKESQVDFSLPFQDLANSGAGTYTLAYETAFTTYYIEDGELESVGMCTYADYYTFVYGTPGSCDHSYSSAVTKEADCTSNGVRTYTCAKCGAVYSERFSALGHAYGSWITEEKQTCTTDGVKTSTCANCGDVQQQISTASGHSYTSETINATCTEYEKIRYNCTQCGDSYEEYSALDWSDWSLTIPEGINEDWIESRTEYRYQTKELTSGSGNIMDGWTLYDTSTQWGDYGAWSDWSDTAVSASDTTKVETRTVYGYYYFLCPYCGAHMHGYGYCYTWAGGCGNATDGTNWRHVWSTISWDDAGLMDWYGTGKYYTYINGELVFKWPEGGSKTQYRYCTRETENVYHFYRWTDWSDWSETAVSAGENQNVETRTTYRYVVSGLGDHSWSDGVCSVCGVQEPVTEKFTLSGANMVLGSVLDMNFFINKADLSDIDYYAEITHYAEDGTTTATVSYDQWDERTNYMVVTLEDLAARQMADKIEVVIYNSDGTQASEVWTDSIRDYAMRILENQDAGAKTMLVDMLNYGAAAQTYFEYNTTDLANSQLTMDQQAYATETASCTDQRVKGDNYFGSTLVLKNHIMLTMYFQNITTDMYADVSFTDHKGVSHETRIEGDDFAQYNSTTYGVTVDDLVVADGDQLVTVTVYHADGNVVAYASDTVNSYASRMMSSDVLFEQVAKFTTSAYAYFH